MKNLFEAPIANTLPLQGLGIPPRGGLLKWIGNKRTFAARIIESLPSKYGCYYEPFVGSGAVLAALSPHKAVASDAYKPLIEIWLAVRDNPVEVKQWYAERWEQMKVGPKRDVYEGIKQNFNTAPNGADLLFLCRSCYGGVVRFRKADGHMSTPCGIHSPILPASFNKRVDEWHSRIQNVEFRSVDYLTVMDEAKEGDLIYCDPPYVHTQKILYGAQGFKFAELINAITECKKRGVSVALSIDGHKQSGVNVLQLPIPPSLFKREIILQGGASMLKRFQSKGLSLDHEHVADRLLLTY